MAQVQVAEMYRDGQGVKKDDREAFHWYQKAADQGIADGKLGLANMYRTGTFVEKNPKKALALYEEAQSEAGGLYYKGLMYTTGEGVEKDAAVGRELIYSAAKRGYSDAQVSIGELYKSGTGGMLQDFREAARWFSLAAKQGNVTGQHELAVMYWDGSGVEKSRVTAYAWINLACRSNGQLAKAARARWESQLTESELEQAQILSREWSIHTMVPVVPDNE